MDRPAVTPPGPWSFPDAERTTLPNGLSVLAFHRPGQHVVSVGLHLDVPLSVEPRDLEGVAALTSGRSTRAPTRCRAPSSPTPSNRAGRSSMRA